MSLAKFKRSWRQRANEAAIGVIAAATIATATPQVKLPEAGTVAFADQLDRSLNVKQAEQALGRPLTFREFVDRVRPGYQWYKHCVVLGDVLQKVAEGKIKRLMIFMPPRHGKSELASRLFTAYFLYRYPNRWAALCSYGQGMANTLSRASKTNYLASGSPMSKNARAVKQWETGQGGGLWCAGIRGEMTGKGWHLGVIDDPLKNATEAESITVRESIQDNYQSAFYTREEPNEKNEKDGALIVINTRWNEDDLSGWLLKQEYSDDEEQIEHWHIVSFPAISEEPEKDEEGKVINSFPPTCTVEPDWRGPHEALCPERRPLDKLKRIMRKVGEYFWNSMFQQRPRPRDGGMFKRDWFKQRVNVLPTKRFVEGKEVAYRYKYIRYWDKAGTADGGAYTAGVLMALAEGCDECYVMDVIRGQWSAGTRENKIREAAKRDQQMYGDVTVWVEEEPGSGGKESAENTLKNLAGFTAHKEKVSGGKASRATPLASAFEAMNVWLVSAIWNDSYIEEFLSFPRGTYKDQVDASSGAYNKLILEKESWAQNKDLLTWMANR